MSINRVNISGNLTRDPELRSTAGGTQILSFGVAVNDRRRNAQTGEWEDVPNFIDCVVFGQRADALSRFLSKGSKVAIEGKLRYSTWETREGQRRSKLEVVVDEVEFLSRNQQNSGAPRRHQSHRRPMSMTRIFRFNQRIFSYEGSKKGTRHGSAEARFSAPAAS